jgi:2-oxoglutarate dehydrogenase E2 component (dihydrolipoamide succinyltransferase)
MSIELRIPSAGESIQEVQIGQWLKREGDRVRRDESVVELDTDKASMELPAPSDGVLSRIVKHDGDKVAVGEVIGLIEPDGATATKGGAKTATSAEAPVKSGGDSSSAAATPERAAPPSPPTDAPPTRTSPAKSTPSKPATTKPDPAEAVPHADIAFPADEAIAPPSVRRWLREHHVRAQDVKASGEGGRVLREDIERYEQEHAGEHAGDGAGETALKPEQPPASPESMPGPITAPSASRTSAARAEVTHPAAGAAAERGAEIVPMSLVRRRIAERLVEARQKTALLTTFNEVDMSAVIALRTQHREAFQQKYGVKLGFVSFFVQAAVEALRQFPVVNAEIRGTDIVYHNAYHIGVAIGAERGLVVPVIRDADLLSLAQIEQAVGDFAARAKTNKLQPGELAGGTFTISNGGIFGSLLSTPIVNPPQSAVLGMHTIQERPVARDGQVVIRPMMYVALSYDHRLIDGREAVSFLARIKQTIEEPARLLLGV